MIRTKKLRKIYHTNGLISIIFLIIICYIFFNNYKMVTKGNCMEIRVPDEQNVSEEFSRDGIHLRREFIDYVLTGNDFFDNIKIDNAMLQIRSININKDTIKGIHFIFTDKSKYKSFVKILDMLKMERAGFYTLYNKDLWAFGIKSNEKYWKLKNIPENGVVPIK